MTAKHRDMLLEEILVLLYKSNSRDARYELAQWGSRLLLEYRSISMERVISKLKDITGLTGEVRDSVGKVVKSLGG